MSGAEEALAFQLKAAGIHYEREYRFAPPRRWRFDFVVGPKPDSNFRFRCVGVEVEGGAWNGGHRRGTEADKDCEKSNAAVMAGWRVLRFTPNQVESGVALKTIEEALGR